jgi:PIN domain nuclease of toxin-antitoxin system
VIVLDTHVWIWWVHNDPLLPKDAAQVVTAYESSGLGISAISCWEIAKLVEYSRLILPLPVGVNSWFGCYPTHEEDVCATKM